VWVATLQVSLVHELPSLHSALLLWQHCEIGECRQLRVSGLHWSAVHTSPSLQSASLLQQPPLSTCEHMCDIGSQVSIVHGLPSWHWKLAVQHCGIGVL